MAAAAAVTAAISQSAPVIQMHNWMRLCLGSECYNKDAVRNVLHNKFNNPAYHGLPEDPALLFQELKKFQSDLSKLKTKHRITSAQWKLLYPDSKQTHSTQFDIPLMVMLLEHCTDLPAPVNGWNDSNPPISDQGLSANSLRARSMRHFLYHYGNPMTMDNNEFSTKWTELEDIQNGLGCRTVNMIDLKTGPLDPHRLTYFKCATTFLEEGQKKLLKSNEETASDVKILIDRVSALEKDGDTFSDIETDVMEIMRKYTNLYNKVEKHDIDIKHSTSEMKDLKSHKDLSLTGIRWNIREHVTNFSCREDVLNDIHRYFHSGSTNTYYSAVALSGLGGIGKTEVAAKYVSMYDEEYENIIWLECNDIETSLMELASRMQIKTQVFKVNILTQLICDKLGDGKCMFVLNDVVDNKSIKDFMKNLKNIKNTPCVLITSQYSEWDDVRIKHIPMDVFESDEAVGFLCKCLPKCDPVEVETLVHELQYLPLALQQAKSYILKHPMSISDYTHHIENNRKELLDIRLDETGETEYDKTLLTVWKMAFDKLKEHHNMLAIDILNMMAYMDGSFINPKTFLYLDDVDELKLNEAVDVLCEYSLIQSNTSKIITMHSLVQKITILYEKDVILSASNDTYALKLSELLTKISGGESFYDADPENLWFKHIKKLLLLSHYEAFSYDFEQFLMTATTSGESSFSMYACNMAVLNWKITYYRSGKLEDFKKLLQIAACYTMILIHKRKEAKALEFVQDFSTLFENELAAKNKDWLDWFYMHVCALKVNGKMKEAVELFHSLPDVKFEVDSLYNNFKATVLWTINKKKEALLISEQIFKYIKYKNIITEDELVVLSRISTRFLSSGDSEHAKYILQYMESSLKKIKPKTGNFSLHAYHWSKANFHSFNHQYDECMDELNKCLIFPFSSELMNLHVFISYVQLKRKNFEESKTKLLEVISLFKDVIKQEEHDNVLLYMSAALLCLDEIDEAEKNLKKLKARNYPGNFQEKYLEKINKYRRLNNTLTYRRQRFGDKDAKTIAVLRECVQVKIELKECYLTVPFFPLLAV